MGLRDFAIAGHTPPMLLRRTVGAAEVLRLPATGTIVGVFPEQGYGQRQLALRQGDVLVLFSDGVTEAMNEAGEFFEEERLQELLVSMPGPRAGGGGPLLEERAAGRRHHPRGGPSALELGPGAVPKGTRR
ncbi:MAG: PP2C family protein-serine/threonine phosphatase [Acidobacteriota bacterium]